MTQRHLRVISSSLCLLRVIAAALTVVLAFLSAAARADYPLPRQAGFHHCALIYDKANRGVNELRPLVARSENGKAKEWLFDAFLFLVYTTPRAIDTLSGPTIRSDWQYQLDRWFAPNRDLAALDATIEQAKTDLGAPPRKREVMLAIPYLNPSVKNFGALRFSFSTFLLLSGALRFLFAALARLHVRQEDRAALWVQDAQAALFNEQQQPCLLTV